MTERKNRKEESIAEGGREGTWDGKGGVLYGMPKTFFSFTTSPQSSFDISLKKQNIRLDDITS